MEVVQKGWSVKKIRNTVIILFLLIATLFTYLFYANKDFTGILFNNLPIAAGKPSFLFSVYGSGINGGLKKPMGVTMVNNKIFITDTMNKRVQIFDYSGNYLGLFGKEGKGDGQFEFPYGIVGDGKGQLYIADLLNDKIGIYDEKGKFLRNFSGSKDLKKPGGITIAGGKLYVADIADCKIKIFDLSSGKKLMDVGKPGDKKGELKSPNYVAVYGGKIYVSDSGNERVAIFDDKTGKFIDFLKSFDSKGVSKFTNPRGIGVDGRGTIFVVSNITNKVFGYDTSGKELFGWGGMGQDDDKFALPNGLFIDNNGRIYITDTVNQRVVVYQN